MRTDPTDTGGLFVGRRPGTRPVRYRRVPRDAGARRRRLDAALAALILVAMGLVCASFWVPLPAGWLWIGSHVQYWTGSVSVGILSAFAGLLACLLLGLVIGKQLDRAWILVRRAAGHDQREGVLGRVFAVTCGLGAIVFCAWLLLFSGARLTGGVGG
jgi:ammonia channel protein AmtB